MYTLLVSNAHIAKTPLIVAGDCDGVCAGHCQSGWGLVGNYAEALALPQDTQQFLCRGALEDSGPVSSRTAQECVYICAQMCATTQLAGNLRTKARDTKLPQASTDVVRVVVLGWFMDLKVEATTLPRAPLIDSTGTVRVVVLGWFVDLMVEETTLPGVP